MKKLLLVALMAIGANAQDLTVNGVLRTGTGGSNMALKANGYAEVTQNLYVGGYTFTNNIVATSGAVQFSGARLSGVRAGVAGNDAVNMNQLNTLTTSINNKLETKADKTQVVADIAQAKAEANAYTDEKTSKVQSNLDKESKRLDMKIDSEIQKVESKFNQRITELDTRLNTRIDNVLSYVGNEFKAINNRIDGLGAMTVALSTAATSSVYNSEKPTNVNFATGYYGRSGALALGISHFLSSNTKLSVNYAAGSFTKSAVGVGVGFAF